MTFYFECVSFKAVVAGADLALYLGEDQLEDRIF